MLIMKRQKYDNIISKYSKLPQKEYKNRYDWVGTMMHWELCIQLRFDSTN